MSVSPGRPVSLPELLREVRETSTAILRPHFEALRRAREPLVAILRQADRRLREAQYAAWEACPKPRAGKNRRERKNRRRAAEWLAELLRNGPMEVAAIQAEARAAGVAWRTVRRAREDLGVVVRRRGFGSAGTWEWALPIGGQRPPIDGQVSPIGGQAIDIARRGNVWEVRAFNETGCFKHTVGLEYLAALVARPGCFVEPKELEGGKPCPETSQQPAMDAEALREIRKKLAEYDRDIEAAERGGDATQAELLRRERSELEDWLQKARGLGGRPRLLHNQRDRRRIRIWNAMRRAIDTLRRNGMPKAAEHLEASIRCEGGRFIYSPTSAP